MAFIMNPLNPRLPFVSSHSLPARPSTSFVTIFPTQRLLITCSNLYHSHASLSSKALRQSDEELSEEDSVETKEKEKAIAIVRRKTKNRKPRPSFNAQTLKRWSVKISSQRSSFPWQDQKIQTSEDLVSLHTSVDAPKVNSVDSVNNFNEGLGWRRLDLIVEKLNGGAKDKGPGRDSKGDTSESSITGIPPRVPHVRGIPFRKQSVSAPWAQGAAQEENHIHPNYGSKTLENNSCFTEDDKRLDKISLLDEKKSGSKLDDLNSGFTEEDMPGKNKLVDKESSSYFDDPLNASLKGRYPVVSAGATSQISSTVDAPSMSDTEFYSPNVDSDLNVANQLPMRDSEFKGNRRKSSFSEIVNLKYSMDSTSFKDYTSVPFHDSDSENEYSSGLGVRKLARSVSVPWERETDSNDRQQLHRSNTELAERTIPEPELRRLRDAALRMKERMTVGPAGVTEAVVKSIHEKWKETEVVKLRFEGPPSLNMKRTHDILENKTGGLVIFRSGRSVVLYRGMTYQLPCILTYSKLADSDCHHSVTPSISNSSNRISGSPAEVPFSISRSSEAYSTTLGDVSEGNLDTCDIDRLLDQLGPRFKDWSGRNPLPVDADMLPGVVPDYKPPFRLLPYKTRRTLRDRQMTALRRLARSVPPHFALGRNRQHEGLAAAIVKLWEKSSIAKIAIKRGIPNTCNERMAEEIKKLTGGVLLSRNKEYIVFYRGNDFVAPSVREVLLERQKVATIHQDKEEAARLRALASVVHVKNAKGPLVAGTLAETVEAKSRWGKPLSSEEVEMMKKNMVLVKHASLVRQLERKLIFAKAKVRKAEKALAKVQEFLEPTDLPTDLETITDEERSMFRQIGLKMKGALLLGRRGVFGGTVENMHLSWKHRELVKVLVKGKNFAQVKHIAVSLEAESGGVLISLDKTTKGFAIIIYRGKNYQRPRILRPKNLLTRRQALARSIELQRREALIHHIADLQTKIQMLKSQLDEMESNKEQGKQDLNLQVDDIDDIDDDDYDVEDEGEEAYLKTYSSGEEDAAEWHNQLLDD